MSVRDENSVQLVRALTGREAQLILDPTLIYDFTNELKLYQAKQPGSLVVYSTKVKPFEQEAIQHYAKAFSLKVVALGYPHGWADLDLSQIHPLQTLAEFQSARAIFTNTFHGTALAIKFNRPFLLGDLTGKHNKISSLLKTMKLSPIKPVTSYEWFAGFSEKPNVAMQQRLNCEKENTLSFLKNSLTGLRSVI